MTLSLNSIVEIRKITVNGLSQRVIATIIGHAVASVNKYSKLLRYCFSSLKTLQNENQTLHTTSTKSNG